MVKYDRKQDERELWDFHEEWETYTAYSRFTTYYLPMNPPRTILGAYRDYCRNERNISEEKIMSYKGADATWSKWAAADDAIGKPAWKERASAYDVEMVSRFKTNIEVMRQRLLTDDLKRINKLAERWDEFYAMSELLKVTSENVFDITDGDGKVVGERVMKTLALNIGEFRSLIRALDDITIQQRRIVGLPAEIKQNNIADNEGNKMDLGSGLVDMLAPTFQDWQQKKRKEKQQEKESDE